MTAIDDLRKRLGNRRWRLNNLYYIVNADGQRVKFVPNAVQLDLLDSSCGSDIILKARQLGVTTLMCIIGLDEAVFYDNWSVAIIAHTLPDANEIFETKVKYPYDNLPEFIRRIKPAKNDRAGRLSLSNSSSIRVVTSGRSSTLQRLHVSEFGKICSHNPQRAREIVTGAFPAVGKNALTIESTAEGQDGYFYQYCTDAMAGRGNFKFHFYPWWEDPTSVISPDQETPTREQREYFEKLKVESGIETTPAQQAWYVRQEYSLGADMMRENPSTAEEAFEQAIEGAYFASQLTYADRSGHIGRFPYDPRYPVNWFFDLGRNDMTTMWCHQAINGRNRFIGYYENSGEHISHYFRKIREFQKDKECEIGDLYWPHDGGREDLFLEDGRIGEADKHGFNPVIVPRVPNKMDAIEAARAVFPSCDFDESECDTGLKRLRHYRKEWDDKREVWRDRPLHDKNSHGADGFMTFATGYQPPVHRERRQRASGWGA